MYNWSLKFIWKNENKSQVYKKGNQTYWMTMPFLDQKFLERVAVIHVILNNNAHSMGICLVVFHPICTASTMPKAIVQNMKPTKSRVKRLLSGLCPQHIFFKLIIGVILCTNNFTCLYSISTVSYIILSIRYCEEKSRLISFMNTNIRISTMEHDNVWCDSRFRSINRQNVSCHNATLNSYVIPAPLF